MRLYGVFTGEGIGEAVWAGSAALGLAGLNNFVGLLGVGTALSCLTPGPGMIRAEREWINK